MKTISQTIKGATMKFTLSAIVAITFLVIANPASAKECFLPGNPNDPNAWTKVDCDKVPVESEGMQAAPAEHAPLKLAPKSIKMESYEEVGPENEKTAKAEPEQYFEEVVPGPHALEVRAGAIGSYTERKYGSWFGGSLNVQGIYRLGNEVSHNYLLYGIGSEYVPQNGAGNFFLASYANHENVTMLNPFVGYRRQASKLLAEVKLGTGIDPSDGNFRHPLTIEGTTRYFITKSIAGQLDGQARLFGDVDTWDLKASGVYRLPISSADVRLFAGPELVHVNEIHAPSARALGVQGGIDYTVIEEVTIGLTAAHAKELGATGGLNLTFRIR